MFTTQLCGDRAKNSAFINQHPLQQSIGKVVGTFRWTLYKMRRSITMFKIHLGFLWLGAQMSCTFIITTKKTIPNFCSVFRESRDHVLTIPCSLIFSFNQHYQHKEDNETWNKNPALFLDWLLECLRKTQRLYIIGVADNIRLWWQ